MTTKHWKISALRGGLPVTLFVTTTDDDIATDIACGKERSMTLIGRSRARRRDPTPETDHADFATGAFVALAGYDDALSLSSDPIAEVESIPPGLRQHNLGGGDAPFLTAVYEQPA